MRRRDGQQHQPGKGQHDPQARHQPGPPQHQPLQQGHERHIQRGNKGRLAAWNGLQADGLQTVAEHDRHPDKHPGLELEQRDATQTAQENSATMAAAAAKRRPTKNIGPLAVKACCTNRKVMPQTMVIRISTHSALLKRDVNDSNPGSFNDIATLRVTGMETHNAPKLGSILRSPTR